MLLVAPRSVLLIVDVQERLVPAMQAPDRLIANLAILLAAAHALCVPVLASEQYPKGLGPTLTEIAVRLAPPGLTPVLVEKTHFSCLAEPGFAERIAGYGRDQLVVAGIETHVCVLQTAMDAVARRQACFVVADACSSRTTANAERALSRLEQQGVSVVTTEMVAFEWLHRAGTPAFRAVSQLVR